MKKHAISLALSLLFVLVASTSGRRPQESGSVRHPQAAPKRGAHHLILGVPFVRWGEAAALNYPSKDILEPSQPAVTAMMLRYWGYDEKLLEDPNIPYTKWHNEAKEDGSLEDLKNLIDRDIPVKVRPTLTPFAHRLYVALSIFAALQDIKLETNGSSTNVLGKMVSLDQLAEFKKKNAQIVVNESTELAVRLVIGYDDERQVISLHDPSFGPNWEVNYADFDKMWSFFGRSYEALLPPNSAKILANKQVPGPYPARSADNEAAVHYVYGYAMENIGRTEDADREFRTALAMPGISTAYQHLLHFELASTLAHRGRHEEAIAETQKAIDLYSDNPVPWQFLADGLRHSKVGSNWKKRAADAEKRAASLCTEGNERKVAHMLANDFRLVGCKGEYLGWGLR